MLRPVFPLLAPGSPGNEGRCRRARTSRPDCELFFTLPLLDLSSVLLQSCPRSASEGEPRLSRRAEAWPFSIPSPGLRLQAGAVQSGLGLLTELASPSRAGSALATEFLFLRRVPALFSQTFGEGHKFLSSHKNFITVFSCLFPFV